MAEIKESKVAHTIRPAFIYAGRFVDLALKVVDELRDFDQFFDTERRNQLILNGRIRLASLGVQAVTEVDPYVKFLEKDAKWLTDNNSFQAVITSANVVGVIVPGAYKCFTLSEQLQKPKKLPPIKLAVTGPTFYRDQDRNQHVSSEGLKTKDGIIVPFKDWKYGGGIIVDNAARTIDLLNNEETQAKSQEKLKRQQALIGGNCYMDSDNYMHFLEDDPMRDPRVHNGIGMFYFADGRKCAYSLVSDVFSVRDLKAVFGLSHPHYDREIASVWLAALSQHMAQRVGAERWRYIGCEFRNGGSVLVGSNRGELQVYNSFGFYR